MKNLLVSASLLIAGFANAADVKTMSFDELKSEIVSIASENTNRLDNWVEVREQLNPLVEELVERANQTVDERVEGKVGSWKQLWTDDTDDTRPNNAFSSLDRDRTFQVVDADGFFYNISEIKTKVGLRATAFLRGTYKKQGEGIAIKFTNLDIKALGTKNITETVYKLEEKKEKFFPATRLSKYPRGPVGAEGYINTVYVDDEMRVDFGYNTADKILDMFVLIRM